MTIIISSTAIISHLADIEDSVQGSIIKIGEESVIDSFVKIKPAGGSGDVVIGNRVNINSGCMLYTGNGIMIGNNVAIAANCVFAPVNHAYKDKDVLIINQGFSPSKGGIIIEDDVWIGAGCILLDGCVVGRGAVIGAMSLIRGYIPRYTIAAGNPIVLQGQRS